VLSAVLSSAHSGLKSSSLDSTLCDNNSDGFHDLLLDLADSEGDMSACAPCTTHDTTSTALRCANQVMAATVVCTAHSSVRPVRCLVSLRQLARCRSKQAASAVIMRWPLRFATAAAASTARSSVRPTWPAVRMQRHTRTRSTTSRFGFTRARRLPGDSDMAGTSAIAMAGGPLDQYFEFRSHLLGDIGVEPARRASIAGQCVSSLRDGTSSP